MDTHKDMTVLLVEDDEIDAEKVRRLLPHDATLKHATTLHDALKLIEEPALDLILLDPGLPDSSGVASFRQLREHAPKVPVVILTGLHDRQLALNIIREGAQDYLLKDQLDERALQALHFAVERGRLLLRLEDEQRQRERLAGQLREQEQSLAHLGRVALMGELVAEVTHEVSQPLNVISTLTGAIEASLQQSETNNTPVFELVRKLGTANAHASEVLNRLRDFIRNTSTTFERFDLCELIVSTMQFVDYERHRRRIEIEHNFDRKQLWVRGNTTQIQQVIVNLLRNAFDAMAHTPEADRRVTMRAYPHEDLIRVDVIDRGSGLKLGVEEAFSPFSTTKSQGLGMGLAICARILHNHQGTIAFVPGEDIGSVFRFEIPSA